MSSADEDVKPTTLMHCWWEAKIMHFTTHWAVFDKVKYARTYKPAVPLRELLQEKQKHLSTQRPIYANFTETSLMNSRKM